MAVVTDLGAPEPAETAAAPEVELYLVGTLAAALVVGGALAGAARAGATPLLVVIAVVQVLFALGWVLGTEMPGRIGGLVLAALAGSAADVTVSVWPHGKLGTLLPALGLAVAAMFVHQLARGAVRSQVASSLSAIAVLVFAEVALPALLQLRHELSAGDLGGRTACAAAAAIGGALVVGCLVDLVFPAPRFDPAVARGLLGLVASAGLGASLGYLLLHDQHQFAGGRAGFVGAALGALAGLLAVASGFVLHTTPEPAAGYARRLRPLVAAVLPMAVLAPVAFLLCLAIRA
jgi:hypothetical protein